MFERIDIRRLENDTLCEISSVLLEGRIKKGITQEKVAEQTGYEPITIRRYERGEFDGIKNIDTVINIATFYGIDTLDEILRILLNSDKIIIWEILEKYRISNVARVQLLSFLYFGVFGREPEPSDLYERFCKRSRLKYDYEKVKDIFFKLKQA